MSVGAKFEALVKNLDQGALEELGRSVAAEIGERGLNGGGGARMKIGDIHPGMSAQEKEQAAQEIARVLKER
jgi:hypothetical protein